MTERLNLDQHLRRLEIPERNGSHNEALEALRAKGYGVVTGINTFYIRQLIEKSLQPNIITYVPDDAARRFRSFATVEEWYPENQHKLYSMTTNGGDLAGTAWFTRKGHPHLSGMKPPPDISFAIRIYAGHNGQGLMTPFMKAVH